MITLIDRAILFFAGCMITDGMGNIQMVYMLIGLICVGVTYYESDLQNNILEQVIYFVIVAGSFFAVDFIPFLPIIVYAFVYKYVEKTKLSSVLLMAITILSFINIGINCRQSREILAIFVVLSVVMAVKSKYILKQEREVKRLRDDSQERNDLLMEKNKVLMNNLDNEIHIAVLSERNRIAREIHDNVGHLLSRSILQVGAIMAVSKDEKVQTLIVPVRNTLDEAMNSIRESVHDLHKESFDTKSAAQTILADLKDYEVILDCDISMEADKEVKYMFLTILKEAVNNIEKHCDGDKVEVVIRELDEYYQMVIEDNGERIRETGNGKISELNSENTGIGLVNMRDRVQAMQGIIKFSFEKGFRIFISLPKNRE